MSGLTVPVLASVVLSTPIVGPGADFVLQVSDCLEKKVEKTYCHYATALNAIALVATIASFYFFGVLGTTLGAIAIGFNCTTLAGRAYRCFRLSREFSL